MIVSLGDVMGLCVVFRGVDVAERSPRFASRRAGWLNRLLPSVHYRSAEWVNSRASVAQLLACMEINWSLPWGKPLS